MGSPSKRNRKNVALYVSTVKFKKRRDRNKKRNRKKETLKTYTDPRNPDVNNLNATEYIKILETKWLEENQVRKASAKSVETLSGIEYLRQWKILNNVDEEFLKKVEIALVAKFHWNRFTCAFLILENDEVYVLGDNQFGLLALDKPGGGKIREPNLCPALSNKGIIDISVGQRNAAALTSEGKILTWGMNTNGQLGNGMMEKRACGVAAIRGELENLEVVKFLCRETRVVCFTSCGRLFGWGYNEAGILGRPIAERTVLNPVEICVNFGSKISDFWMDAHATLFVLTEDGKLYSRGCNIAGTCGNGSGVDEHEFVLVKFPAGFRLKQLNPGYCCCLALSEEGKVYGWGCNRRGELGKGLPSRVLKASLIKFDQPVEYIGGSVNVGQLATVFKTFEGKIHVFGRVKWEDVTSQDLNFQDIDQVFAAYGLGMRKCWLSSEHHNFFTQDFEVVEVPNVQDTLQVDNPDIDVENGSACSGEVKPVIADLNEWETVFLGDVDITEVTGNSSECGFSHSSAESEDLLQMRDDKQHSYLDSMKLDVTSTELPKNVDSDESMPGTEDTDEVAETTIPMQVDIDEKPTTLDLLESEVPLSSEFDTNVLFDLSFAVNGHRIVANRYSLRRSLYLRLKVDIDWKHNNLLKPVRILDWNEHVFHAFVKYMHHGVVDVVEAHYFDLLRLAMAYRLNKLRRAVLEKIMVSINEENAISTYALAIEVKSEDLEMVSLNFISTRFWKLVGRVPPDDDVNLSLIGKIATDLARLGFKTCVHDQLPQQ